MIELTPNAFYYYAQQQNSFVKPMRRQIPVFQLFLWLVSDPQFIRRLSNFLTLELDITSQNQTFTENPHWFISGVLWTSDLTMHWDYTF